MYDKLKTQSRLLFEIPLVPLQGKRFQPTGFPDLGAAEFADHAGERHLLVESAQSMANRLEAVCWDEASNDLTAVLRGMPYVKGTVKKLGDTSSLLEAHRLNSPYLVEGIEDELVAELDWNKKVEPDRRRFAKYLLKRDPNSLVHGCFFSNIKPGSLRLPRLLSAFIEAETVNLVPSGGVKQDRLDASGPSREGKGHVPFARAEYTAEKIVAYFNLDLHQLRSLGLGEEAEQFLITLCLFKIRRFLEVGLRLRTACDLEVLDDKSIARRPKGFKLPSAAKLEKELKAQVASLAKSGQFAQPPVLEVSSQ